MKRFLVIVSILACFALIMACVTVNIYFPAAEIQRAADEIVDEVRQAEPGEEGSFFRKIRRPWLLRLASSLTPDSAFAQVDIDISSPAIRQLKDSLAARFGSLKGFYSQGNLGENNGGYVEIRDESGLNLKDKAKLRKLAEAEKADRKALYMEILRANNLDTQFLPQVEKLFANSWRNKAVPGTWIQGDEGTWARK
jgi:uncharacterized protein YdbL (DUF1318 family)